jgi:hypothetical protein
MNSKNIRRYSCVTALLISGCVSASASVVVYTDRTSWLSATSTVNTIAFEAITGSIMQYNGGANGDTLTIGSVSFQGFDHQSTTSNFDLEVNNQVPSWGTGAVLQGPGHADSFSRIVATVGAGIFAIGSDVFNNNGGTPDSGTVNVVLSTGATVYPVNTIAGTSSHAFIGFVSDTAISSISFFPQSVDNVVIDNFSTGGQATSPTPETATLVLCGIGLLLMRRLWRKSDSDAELHRGAARSPFVMAGAEA